MRIAQKNISKAFEIERKIREIYDLYMILAENDGYWN